MNAVKGDNWNKLVSEYMVSESYTDRKYCRIPKESDKELKGVSEKLNIPENILVGLAIVVLLGILAKAIEGYEKNAKKS